MRVTAAAVLVLLLAAGCSGTPDRPAPGPGSAVPSPAQSRPVFDPPTRFDTADLPLGAAQPGDVLLHDQLAFVAGPAAVTVTDVTSGRQVAQLAPPHPPVTDPIGAQPSRHTPLLVDQDGTPAVLVPYTVTVPASGTTLARQAVELVLADARTGQLIRTIALDAAPAAPGSAPTGGATLVGAAGNIAVLRLGAAVTLAVDLSTGTTRWRANDFGAAALVGDTVLGLTSPDGQYLQAVTGRHVTDGTTRFTGVKVRYPALVAAGPGFAALVAEQATGKGFYALVPATGTLSHRTAGSYGARLSCWYDATSITVCALGSQQVFAIDATTGDDLWQLPATGRQAPDVTTVWHGVIYGTAGGQPVVLDAHTGTDKQTSPGLAPVAVNGYVGVAAGSDLASLTAHRTLG